jgi:Xaa-Pro aminopeptidase
MTKREYLESRLRDEMAEANVDAVVSISPQNVQHLAGVFIISQRMIPDRLAFAVYPMKGSPFFVVSTVVEYTARTRSWIDDVVTYKEHAVLPIDGFTKALKEHGLEKGRIWLETGFLPSRDADRLRASLPNLEILDAEGVLNRSRMIKTPDEIELMKKNAGIWENSVQKSFLAIREGEPEREIAKRLIQNLLIGGADWVPFISFATGAEHTLIPHWVADESKVRRGDIIHVDMVGFFKGYYTDFGRMAVLGGPSPQQREAYGKIIALQREVISRAKTGVPASSLYRQSVEVGKQLGMDFSMDAIGHSLGIHLHEYPVLSPHENQPLADDMLVCIEISHSFSGLGNFHVEDLVRVTRNGGERLTTIMNTNEMLAIEPV